MLGLGSDPGEMGESRSAGESGRSSTSTRRSIGEDCGEGGRTKEDDVGEEDEGRAGAPSGPSLLLLHCMYLEQRKRVFT
jgi:hypothetical protein